MEVLKTKESDNIKAITHKSEIPSISSDDEFSHDSDSDFEGPSTSKSGKVQNTGLKKRGKRKLLDRELTTNLDVAQIRNRKSALVYTPTLNRLRCDPAKYNLNLDTSSIHSQRIDYRQSIVEDIRKKFSADVPLTVHWDGKILENITGQ